MGEERQALERALVHALDFLGTLETRPVAATATAEELRRALVGPLPVGGTPARQVVDELVAGAAGGLTGSQCGRFFGWVIGGSLPSAMAADWLTAAWDQNAGIHAASPAASVAEEVAGAWLKELFGLPPGCGFGLVTGTQMAHVTCLAAARHALLARQGWDVERRGLQGAPRLRVLASADRHGTVDRALRLLGMGTEAIEPLPVDQAGRVRGPVLAEALSRSTDPALVVLQAGELNTGAFDPFEELVPVARDAGAWLHVDGAFGLWARVSPVHAHRVRGVERCDSWTTDGHKVLSVPYDCGFAFVRDAAAHRAAMTLATSYLPAASQARDALDWNPEFSRRARAFPVYAALRELGREGLASLVERLCRHAQALAWGLGELPGAELLSAQGFNQALVRFRAPGAGPAAPDHDRRTDTVIAAINASGEALFGGVTWRGRRAMRVSVSNWRTSEADVERAVAAARRALAATSVVPPGTSGA
ncbi:MAG: aspartate aminotransferase family protein [Deltaproteobacteria bacterium]|nr:aspartate aminotransferase family protein [Deltaproteobacteria bacterium]